jgi:hypothetical protein
VGRRALEALERLAMTSLLFLVGFALVWVPTFLIELGGSFDSYYRRFFGFFSADSGWGTFPGARFEVFPEALLRDRTAPLLGLCALILVGTFQLRRRRASLVAWLSMMLLLWLALAYGYYKNQGGGGLHYYFEYFVFVWVFVVHSLGKARHFGPLPRAAISALVLSCLPWTTLLGHCERAYEMRTRARTFVEQVAQKTQGEPIFGEDTHLFKTEYRGEVVDTGDAVHAMARSKYLGEAFSSTYRNYVFGLQRSPPRFVLVAVLQESPFHTIMTPTLRGLLLRRYQRVLIARDSAFALGGSQALYELRPTHRTTSRSARPLE